MWPFEQTYPTKSLESLRVNEYDYIIVGGGTAGCVVASRLSEDPDVTVLVLERGPVHDDWLSRVPLASCTLDAKPGVVRQYSTPVAGCDDREILICSSESLGGTSTINGMIYTRSVPATYNDWAQRTGYSKWTWDAVEPFFRRIESALDEELHQDYGRGGPLHLRRHQPLFDFYASVKESASALGVQNDDHINSQTARNAAYFPLDCTIDSEGCRHSAFRAYLPKQIAIERQARLTVCMNAIVTQLEIDGIESNVQGVHVLCATRATRSLIRARREVIVCGGAVRSPQLLQLSGIGPASLLQKHDITLKKDLNVGMHLADHIGVPICLQLPLDQTLHFMENSLVQGAWQLLRFFYNATGYLTTSPVQAAIFFNTEKLDADQKKSTDIGHQGENGDTFRDVDNIPNAEVMVTPANTVAESYHGQPIASLYTCLVQPRSEGRVEIVNADPGTDPMIYLNFLSDAQDVAILRKAVRFSLALAEQVLQKSPSEKVMRLQQAPKGGAQSTDEEIDQFIRAKAQAGLHLACSCRMGREVDGGVVDEELKVHGFKNLRIADTSVFPAITSGHTMAPAYMVAERCADFVKRTWR
ncbi:hypothetical protein GGR51DRAFT_533810 [Nemania sp. FL0031]|nr:hypothetical protein GGR51DRAFT_533810 [Nemania sp. FL0031]